MILLKRHLGSLLYVLLLAGLLGTYAHILSGCGGSALQYHAQAAEAVRVVNDQGVEIVEEQCEARATTAASDREVDTDTAAANAQAILDTCARIQNAQHAAAEAHGLWVNTLVQIVAEERDATGLASVAIQVARLYAEVVNLAADFDLELPALPAQVLSLIGGNL